MAGHRKHPPKDERATCKVIEQMATAGHSTIGLAKHFNVSRSTFQRWLDESEALSDAYQFGRDANRQSLEELLMAQSMSGKQVAGLIFLLKAKHKLFDIPVNPTKVAVNVDARQPVMVVKSSGSDEEWARKAAKQQAKLVSEARGDEQKSLPEPAEARQVAKRPKARKPAPSWAGPAAVPIPGDTQPQPKREVRWKRGA